MHARLSTASLLAALAVSWLAAQPVVASALPSSEPVRRIAIEVQPYYRAADEPDGTPMVAVGARLDPLLASNDARDVLAARDLVLAEPALITPMSIMVLAIRLYDVGERDEAVFWHYVGVGRYVTMAEVLDVQAPGLFEPSQAALAFIRLAGPMINSYGFCAPDTWHETRLRALDWVQANPYQVLFDERLPAAAGERGENLAKAHERIRVGIDEDSERLADPEQRAEVVRQRSERDVDAQFCWQD